LLLPLLVALVFAAACDDSFQPFDDTGPPFSIFGYLDASADTQFIRMRELRSVLLAPETPTGIVATLEDAAIGRMIELRDSATRYAARVGFDSLYAHNFWTAERIEPGASYRLRVRSVKGAVAEALVQIPRDYQVEVWSNQPMTSDPPWSNEPGPPQLRVTGLKHIAFLVSHTTYYDACTRGRLFRRAMAMKPGGDSAVHLVAAPRPEVETWAGCGVAVPTRLVVEVVGSEAAWPDGDDFFSWRLGGTTELGSNVSNSIGFVGGVLTRSVPIERCAFAYRSDTVAYCKLRYDSTTATLRGTVTGFCPGAVDSVRVALRELDAVPPDLPRIRTATQTGMYAISMGPGGDFEVGALRPGIRHELTVTGGTTFLTRTDTLTFTAGQQATFYTTLQPVGPCPR